MDSIRTCTIILAITMILSGCHQNKHSNVYTLESDVLCKSIGHYIVHDYSHVSPSTCNRYAFDYKGRKVFQDGCTYAGAYSFVAWDYDDNDRLKVIYWSADFEPEGPAASNEEDDLPMLVYKLTNVPLTDPSVVRYAFEYHKSGNIRRVYNPKDGQEIVCPPGGEIVFRVYEMDGNSSSEQIGNDALNIEFRVKGPKTAGTWSETLSLGYRKIARIECQD